MDERNTSQLVLIRRLYIIWAVFGILVVLALCYLVFIMLGSRASKPVSLGRVDDFSAGSITLRYVNAQYHDPVTNSDFTTLALQVERDTAGNFTVFFARSTHPRFGALTPRQCVVEYDPATQFFGEPCEGSKWTEDGKYHEGPAPRDLDRFPAKMDSGNLMIDLELIPGAEHS